MADIDKKEQEEKDDKKEQEEKDDKKEQEEKDDKKEQEEKDDKKEQEEKDDKKEQEEKDDKSDNLDKRISTLEKHLKMLVSAQVPDYRKEEMKLEKLIMADSNEFENDEKNKESEDK